MTLNLVYDKNKLYKTLDYWSRDIVNFGLLKIGLRIVSPQHFVNNFSRKMSLMLHFINRPDLIVWLPLLFQIFVSQYMYCCFPGCDVINFGINLIFPIKPFFYMTKKSRQNFKYLENKNAFKVKWKAISSFLKGLQLPKIVSDLRERL